MTLFIKERKLFRALLVGFLFFLAGAYMVLILPSPLWFDALDLGLAYQLQDDIFDVELHTDVRGKTQGADAQLNKSTYPAILGIHGAKQGLHEITGHIYQQLAELRLTDSPLAQLVHLIFDREF